MLTSEHVRHMKKMFDSDYQFEFERTMANRINGWNSGNAVEHAGDLR